jgi:hypothetical protein
MIGGVEEKYDRRTSKPRPPSPSAVGKDELVRRVHRFAKRRRFQGNKQGGEPRPSTCSSPSPLISTILLVI